MCQGTKLEKKSYEIIKNYPLTQTIFEMIIACPEIVKSAKAGQFVNLYCHHQGRLLPRPISICELDHTKGYLQLVYGILGEGTKEFSTYKAGDRIEVLGPFGNGFDLSDKSGEHLIIGGGVGTPPMVELCKKLKGNKTIVVGFRKEPYLVDRLKKYGQVYVATDDGSVGFKGNVVQLMEKETLKGKIYACGPIPMLRGIQHYATSHHLKAQLSLEERMGCGFGGCVGCVTKIKADSAVGYTYKKVCKDGPIFCSKEVILS